MINQSLIFNLLRQRAFTMGKKQYTKMAIKLIFFFLLSVFLVTSCNSKPAVEEKEIQNNVKLARHTDEFKKEIIEVVDGVYVAIGYGLANSILVEGNDGVIIIDAMESAEAAIPVKEAFNKISNKPVKAIIYTHYHSDHTLGSKIMAGNDTPDVYAHESTPYYLDKLVTVVREIIFIRAARQFGTYLQYEEVVNAGIGPELLFNAQNTPTLIRPNKTFKDHMAVEISGVKLELFFAPGETPDQIFIWLPDKKVLLPGDNIYKSFPNLYAIRGTPYRDVMKWVNSLDKIRGMRAQNLIPCHSRPLVGSDVIFQTLTDYRDAIQYVHDQTIRGINKGLTPDELVEYVKLPKHLSESPFLQEYYGTVEWSVRSIFNGYLGWFSGNSADLFRLPIKERARRFENLAGGRDQLLGQAKEAVNAQDYQWALELTDQLLVLDPNANDVKALRAESLNALGRQQISANARHYYMTQALELQNKIDIDPKETKSPLDIVHSVPLAAIFQGMSVKLNAQKSMDINQKVSFQFSDSGESYTVHVRRGVAEIQPRLLDNPDITVKIDSTLWKEIASGVTNPAGAFAKGKIKVTGGTIALVKFLSLFKE
ncbi:MAG: MBL fold metallo-hydrolase [Desulfobacterales bacterium]|nr:MBL fold metallo-hydrolase [Desulfobacterales bacterium]